MKRASEGDRRAFDTLAENYANMVISVAYRLLGSREDAMDCAQDAFVRAWENAGRYNPKWSVATWLRRIVTNLALDRLRRRKMVTGLPEGMAENFDSGVEGPTDAALRKERAGQVWENLEFLPEKYRAVLVLREMEGLDIAEISRITATQAATVRWRLHRARALFRERWSHVIGEE
jgi:RNA polymerase sigma-70 factor (ECF subfamily)